MTAKIDYYFGLTSPWSYLGHNNVVKIATETKSTITPYEVSFRSTIFGKTGGVPVHKRAPERQKYRLQELARWSNHLKLPLNIRPKYWPNDETTAANMFIVVRETVSTKAALEFAGCTMHGVWCEEQDITDKQTLLKIAHSAGLDGKAIIEEAENPKWAALRKSQTDAAIERSIFGAPSYCVEDQIYWGQDRLDFVERHLRRLNQKA